MSTTQSFSAMLKRFMPYNLLVEEMAKRNYLWRTITKDETWQGGRLEVPFEGGQASSIKIGELTAANDVSETVAVLGYEDNYRELWGTMIFNEKDLDLNNDLKGSFLKVLPGKIDQFVSYIEQCFSHVILNGPAIDKFTATATSGGVVDVNFPERFSIGQKVIARKSTPTAIAGYVVAINMETKKITLYDARSGGSAIDLSTYTVALSSALYQDGSVNISTGALQNNFNSLKDSLLSAANGGSANIHNQVKASYPFLQAQNIIGSGITASNILEEIFDAFYTVTRIGKGRPSEILVSFKHYANMAKDLETNRRFAVEDSSSGYGFVSIKVRGPQGSMVITALREMDDDAVFIIDFNALKFFGSHFFDRKRHFDNQEYMVRNVSGYQYIVDIRLYGNLIVSAPSYCGIIHSISY